MIMPSPTKSTERACVQTLNIVRPRTNNNRNITIKIKNRTFAISALATEMPVKPNNAATIDMIKKNKAHFNIANPLKTYCFSIADNTLKFAS